MRTAFSWTYLSTQAQTPDKYYIDFMPAANLGIQKTSGTLTFEYLNIQKIILRVDGFDVITKTSNSMTSFYSNDPSTKNEIVSNIRTNASKYLGKKIDMIIQEDSNNLIVKF